MEPIISDAPNVSYRQQTHILIVDDHPFVRQGIAQYINQEHDMQVTGEASDGHEALDLLSRDSFDLVISDIEMEGLNGLSFMRAMRDHHPDIPVVMLTMHDEIHYGMRSLQAGAQGYVMKSDDPDKLLQAIRSTRRGEPFYSKKVVRQCIQTYPGNKRNKPLVENLSEREWDVYRWIGKGLRTREIASELHIQPKTVETYKSRIKEKMGFKSASELARHAIEWHRSEGRK